MNFPTNPKELDQTLNAMQQQGFSKNQMKALYDQYVKNENASSEDPLGRATQFISEHGDNLTDLTKEKLSGIQTQLGTGTGIAAPHKSFGDKLKEGIEAAPQEILGKGSFFNDVAKSSPITYPIGMAMDAAAAAGDSIIHGVETIGKGVKGVYQTVKDPNKDLSQKVTGVVQGGSDIISGGMEANPEWAAGLAVIKQVPGLNWLVDKMGQGVDMGAKAIADKVGTNQEEKDALHTALTNLFTLGAAKYAPKVLDTVGEKVVAPVVNKVGGSLQALSEKAPSLSVGSKEYNPDIVKAATDIGVDLPASAATGSEFVRGLEALQKNGLFSKELTTKAETAHAKIDTLTKDLVKKLDTNDLSKFDFGLIAKTGFEGVKDAFKETKNALYDAADTALTDSKVKTKFISPKEIGQTNTVLSDLIKQRQSSVIPTSSLGYFEALQKGLNSGKLTIESIRQTLRDVGSKMGDINDAVATGDKGSLSRIYAAMSQDLDTIYSTKAPAFSEAIEKANSYYKQNLDLINGKFGSMMEHATPEEIYKKFVKPNNPTALGDMKLLLGDEAFSQVSGVFLKDLVDKSIKDDKFSVKTFTDELKKWDEKTLSTILTPDQMARLQEVKTDMGKIGKVQDALIEGEKKYNGSQTGPLNKISTMKTILTSAGSGAGFSVLAGSALGGALFAGFVTLYLLQDYAGSKFLTSEFGKKLMSTGVKLPGTKGINTVGEFFAKNADTISKVFGGSVSAGLPGSIQSQNTNKDDGTLQQ